MAESQSKQKNRREEIEASVEATKEETPILFVFKIVGDKISGTVDNCAMVNTVIAGEQKYDAKGSPKRHLRVLVRNADGLNVVDLNSENAKTAYKAALEEAGFRGLAKGDNFTMEYTGDDAPLGDNLNKPRAFAIAIS